MLGVLNRIALGALAGACALVLSAAGAAHADIGPGSPGGGIVNFIDGGLPDGGSAVSDRDDGVEAGAEFSISSGNPLTRFTWYGSYGGSSPSLDDFSIRIMQVNGGVVDTSSPLAFDATGVVREAAPGYEDQSIYLYVLDVAAFVLDSGDYLLAISNRVDTDGPWYWATSAEGSSQSRDLPDGLWSPQPVGLAFAIGGPVPIIQEPDLPSPPALALLALGALATIAARRRARA